MAITYKSVLTEAVRGFNKIQNKLSTFSDLSIDAVLKDGTSVTKNITPAQMVSAIDNMATLKKSDGTFIKGKLNFGTITNNTSNGSSKGTIQAGKQIKIGKGYYENDSYYTAWAPSGEYEVSSAGSGIDISAYSTLKVNQGSASVEGGALTAGEGSVTGSSTISFSANNTSGLEVYGSGTVSRSNITLTKNTGWISSSSGTVITGTSLSFETAKKYISGVTISSGNSLDVTNNGTLSIFGNGSATIGSSGSLSTLTISNNTYGTINIWNNGEDKGVQVSGHSVIVDGVGVTNTDGDLLRSTTAQSTNSLEGSSTTVEFEVTDGSVITEEDIMITTTSSVSYNITEGWIDTPTISSSNTTYYKLTDLKDKEGLSLIDPIDNAIISIENIIANLGIPSTSSSSDDINSVINAQDELLDEILSSLS